MAVVEQRGPDGLSFDESLAFATLYRRHAVFAFRGPRNLARQRGAELPRSPVCAGLQPDVHPPKPPRLGDDRFLRARVAGRRLLPCGPRCWLLWPRLRWGLYSDLCCTMRIWAG